MDRGGVSAVDSPPVLHKDEIPVDADLVRRLVDAQFPEWVDLPVEPFDSGGTSHWIFRLGDERYVRLPRRPLSIPEVEAEQRWLPRLASQLPVRIPEPIALGLPGEGYPVAWSVYDWLPGEPATPDHMRDPVSLAFDLAAFVQAMRVIDAPDAPPPGSHNSGRGAPLADRHDSVQRALAKCEGLIDVGAASAAWDWALDAPVWDGAPTLVHGDLLSGNVLVVDGRLSGVIDFGCLALGDPANDMLPAWALFGPHARQVFRDAVEVDDASWRRGSGWAISVGLSALPYYLHTNQPMVRQAGHLIDQVVADFG